MRISSEFKTELKKAIKLSTFITVVVFGMVVMTYKSETLTQKREVASAPQPAAKSTQNENCPTDEASQASADPKQPCVETR